MSSTVAVSQDTFTQDVLDFSNDQPVLVDFWAEWCAPCKMLAPLVDQIAAQYKDKIRVVKVDADENGDIMSAYGVLSIPTLILFKGGKDVARVTGFMPKERIMAQFEKHLV